MTQTEQILDFAAHLGRELLVSGANLERVSDSLYRVCASYKLRDVSLFLLNSHVSVAAVSPEGETGRRQVAVPPNGTHMEKLLRLNALSRRVCAETPPAAELEALLQDTLLQTPTYSTAVQLAGFELALSSLCRIFGGGWYDVAAIWLITAVLYGVNLLLSRPGLNRILANTVCMLAAGSLAVLLTAVGLCQNFWAVIITVSFMVIPGIPLVNSVRNLFCGNEMNGILGLFKAVLETLAIVLGLALSIFLFGRGIVQ